MVIDALKTNAENYPRKCVWKKQKETRVKFNPGFRPSHNWAQKTGLIGFILQTSNMPENEPFSEEKKTEKETNCKLK